MRKHQVNHTESEGPLPNPPSFNSQEQDPEHADDLEIEEGEDDEEGEGEDEGEEDGLDEDSDEMKTAIPRVDQDQPSSGPRNQPNSPEHERDKAGTSQ